MYIVYIYIYIYEVKLHNNFIKLLSFIKNHDVCMYHDDEQKNKLN